MASVTITVASSYYKVSLQLIGIPSGTQAYSLIDGSIVSTDTWMEANPPVPVTPEFPRGGPDILDDFSPPPYFPDPCPPYQGCTGYTGPSCSTFVLTANVLGNDEISVPDTTYQVTVVDTRSQENISQSVYSITGTTYDLDTATPISTVPLAGLNPAPLVPPSSA